jgi:hypothetical protein
MYRYDGPLKAHAYLSRFAGQSLEEFFVELNREPDDGAALHEALRNAAEGLNSGWVQYKWKNTPEEPEYTKIAYVVKVVFQGENYFLGSGYNFILGDVVPVSFPYGEERGQDGEDVDVPTVTDATVIVDQETCPGFNLPCSVGSTLQLSSHALSHSISSPLTVDDAFDTITYDSQFTIGQKYVFVFDYNGTCVAHGGNPDLGTFCSVLTKCCLHLILINVYTRES